MVDMLITDVEDELFKALDRIQKREGKTVEDVAREALQEEAERIREERDLFLDSVRSSPSTSA